MNTVIFGGSFNPIHNGHIELAGLAARIGFVDRILLLPDNIPPHKETGEDFAPSESRVEMCRLAASLVEKCEVCDIEIRRGGKSYMFDTLCELEKLYPDDRFFLLVGGDMLVTLKSWYRGEELVKKAGVIAVGRGGTDGKLIRRAVHELNGLGSTVLLLPERPMTVSSTAVREAVSRGCDSLPVPYAIAEYIFEHGLYRKDAK